MSVDITAIMAGVKPRSAPTKPRFPIGYRFLRIGKNRHPETVVDVHTTWNMAGKQVRQRYVAEHLFLGSKVLDVDIPEATIARGKKLD